MNTVQSVFRSLGLNRWHTVKGRIKAGGQAAVLVVENDTGDKGVFRCLLDPDPVAIERFHRELHVLKKPEHQHSNIIELLDFTRTSSEHWYISRFGDSFTKYWKSVRDETDDQAALVGKAVDIIAKLAKGLEVMHSQGIVHRDIKPRNIVMRTDAQSEPVLIDFGIAHVTTLERLTATDEAVGNRRFSPDVAIHRTETVPPWVDIFQLAQLLIWMLQSPESDPWDRPLDWRYVTYADQMPEHLVVAIRGITATCCEESISPKDGGELASLLRQRIPTNITASASSQSVNISRIQEAIQLGDSLRDIALAKDMRAVQAAATAIAPACVEIVEGLHEIVVSCAANGLNVKPKKTKNEAEIVEIAMALVNRRGLGLYSASFSGKHGRLGIYCNIKIYPPSRQSRRANQGQSETSARPIALLQCTKVASGSACGKDRLERHITLEPDGTLLLCDSKDSPISPTSPHKVVEMMKGWIEDPELWASLQQDR